MQFFLAKYAHHLGVFHSRSSLTFGIFLILVTYPNCAFESVFIEVLRIEFGVSCITDLVDASAIAAVLSLLIMIFYHSSLR